MSGTEYPHIDSIYKRDMANQGRLILGEYSRPEFAYLAGNEWTGTEKVDGMNIRIMWPYTDDARRAAIFGGKTDNAQIPASLVTALRALFDDIDVDALLPKAVDSPITLYGEGYGAGIQKAGGNYRKDKSFVLFDCRVGEWWMTRESLEEIAIALGIDIVPVVWRGALRSASDFVAVGFESTWGPFPAEGLVLKPAVDLLTRNGTRLMSKIKTVDFRR